jgi:hypothetical protein
MSEALVSKALYFGCSNADRRRVGKALRKIRERRAETEAVILILRREAGWKPWLRAPEAGKKATIAGMIETAMPSAPPNELLACAECGKLVPKDGQCPCLRAMA